MHDSARRDPQELLRHRIFIVTRLSLSCFVLALLPVYLAVSGALAPASMIVFVFALGPLAAAVLTSRTGNILAGHKICISAAFSLAIVLTIAAGPDYGVGLLWLAVALVEAFLSRSAVLMLVSGGGALTLALSVLLLKATGVSVAASPISDLQTALIAILAIGYTSAIGLGAAYVAEFGRRMTAHRHGGFVSLSEVIGDLVLRFDRTGAVLSVSDNSETLFGLPQREFIGRGFFERVHVTDRPAFLKAVSDAAVGQGVSSVALRLRSPGQNQQQTDGDTYFRWVELRVNKISRDLDMEPPLGEPAMNAASVIAVARDVTQVMTHQQALEEAKSEADKASVWKDRFLANVSHELRTPLNAIIGFSEILATENIAPKDPAKTREYAQIIRESGEHLLSVVNSILDISKIEAGSFDIEPEEFAVRPLVDNCIDMLKLRAESGRVTINRDLNPAINELVADKRALKQIIINLLSNAVKFTPEDGCVTIGMRPEGNSALLWVRDTGIGIKETELGRIGSPFFQAVDSYDRPYEGTGLGLSVVRGLVGLHGGSIRVESGPGAGTCVMIKMPLDCRLVTADAAGTAVIETFPLPPAKAGPADFSLGDGARKIA
ncbi:MAG: PAS domain-containing sensor histidine kinase [Hyphomicrobiales bacterium]|nr:PAS domain-containing sensor histidine kinase [Hyphomicrobiales bacterium]